MRKALSVLGFLLLSGTVFATVPGTDLYVPAVGHGLGAVSNGVQAWWRSDVWIFNPSASQNATVNIYLLLRNQANPTPAVRTVTVNAGETRFLEDIVGDGLFLLDNTFGGLRIVASIPVEVSGRSYDANVTVVGKSQGTSGQFFSGVPADLAIGPGDSTDIIGLDQDGTQANGTWRSNLAFVETTGNPVDLTITLLDGNGTPFGSPITQHLDGREVYQINYVINSAFGTTATNQRIHVAVNSTSTGAVITNASRLDNRTGDPATIESIMIHTVGQFEGVVMDVGTGLRVDGGIQLQISGGALATYSGVAGIPCGSDNFTVDFSPDANTGPFAINADGTFATSVSIGYTDNSNNTLFTTNWTLTGARAADGTWSGMLKSDTSGGTTVGGYDYSTCNALGITRPWRAAWTGSGS
jgi:hypothetical protein